MSIERLQEIWPEWSVEGRIGEGSYGKVYKAVHVEQGVSAYAAIKVISIPQTRSEIDSLRSEGIDEEGTRTYFESVVNDFVNEIKLMHSLKGIQNIVGVEDFRVVEKQGEIGWDIFIRMELLTPFNTYMNNKNLDESDIIKLGIDICTALEICGKRNIIHRDIKTENIFVNDYGYFKLGDFGIARKMENMTGGLSQKGTFNYMAPEVANSTNYDARVDIYSLGIVLYRLLNHNRLPFLDADKQLLSPNDRRIAVERRMKGELLPPPCEASPAMTDLILRACAFDPNQRFATASEMKNALMSVSAGSYAAARDMDAKRSHPDLDKTTSVRQPTPAGAIAKGSTFGKKSPNIIKNATISVAALLVAGVAIFTFLNFFRDADRPGAASDEPGFTAYSKSDEEQIAAIIEQADSLAVSGDYKSALSQIRTGLLTYPASESLSEKEQAYSDAFAEQMRAEALTAADECAQKGEFLSAYKTVCAAVDAYGSDNELQSRANEYGEAYAASILAETDDLLVAGDILGADRLIKTALGNVPDHLGLAAKANEIEEIKPVSLSTALLIDSEQWSVNEGEPVDIFGNTHYSDYSSVIYNSNGTWEKRGYFAEYRVYKQYATLSGTISPYKEINSGTVRIYADDAVIRTFEIGKKTDPIQFSLNISGADYIKFEVDLLWASGVIISDVYLSNLESENSVVTVQPTPPGDTAYTGEPVSLASQTLIDSDKWSVNEGTPVDIFGNSHYSSYSSVLYNSNGTWAENGYLAEYRVYKQFTTLSGTISPYKDINGGTVRIYADDVVIQTFDVEKKTDPIQFSLDISDADYIKFEVDLLWASGVIISDVMLS